MARGDIECPGDTRSYRCSVITNRDRAQITWTVTIPEEMPISVTYFNYTMDMVTILNSYITTVVTNFSSQEFIFSTLEITVRPETADSIRLECSNEIVDDDLLLNIDTSC